MEFDSKPKVKISKQEAALRRELRSVEKQEQKLARAAGKERSVNWKAGLEAKVPDKVYKGLESAFGKGFSLVFVKGKPVIEKGYNKDTLLKDHDIRNYAIQVKGGRKEYREMHKSARRSNMHNLAITTVEGIGLGALGIGMPDIVLFIGTLLKGIYETSLSYGYDCEARFEQLLILKMMAASLSRGELWYELDDEVDHLLLMEEYGVSDAEFEEQIKATASVFAMDMLLLKFIQGLPVVGVIGGAANPVYYQKVMQYVRLKYRKRYLLKR